MTEPKHSPMPWQPGRHGNPHDANGERVCLANFALGGPLTRSEANDAIVLASVNAMHQLNPKNPLAAAEAVVGLVEKAEELVRYWERSISPAHGSVFAEDFAAALAALRKEG